jgi:hypothetical protein
MKKLRREQTMPKKTNFESTESLGVISLVIEEAGEAAADKTRNIFNSPISDVLIATVAAGGGVGIDIAVISLIARKTFGKLGMPAILHVIKTIGLGNAKRGMFFLTIPVALLGLGGNLLAKFINKNQLTETKERLLQEAVEKLHAIIETQREEADATKARADELGQLNLILTDFIEKLKDDLGKTSAEEV